MDGIVSGSQLVADIINKRSFFNRVGLNPMTGATLEEEILDKATHRECHDRSRG